jgi:hypothetical protein
MKNDFLLLRIEKIRMNIFFLNFITQICATEHVDRHVIKMILETCQLLCSAHYFSGSIFIPPYKLTHSNHPCAKWTRFSLANYVWLADLGLELCKEYTYRYGKTHATEKHIRLLSENLPPIEDIGFTAPVQAMPDKYKHNDPIIAYRNYYNGDKRKLHSWKKRPIPEWIIPTNNNLDQ